MGFILELDEPILGTDENMDELLLKYNVLLATAFRDEDAQWLLEGTAITCTGALVKRRILHKK